MPFIHAWKLVRWDKTDLGDQNRAVCLFLLPLRFYPRHDDKSGLHGEKTQPPPSRQIYPQAGAASAIPSPPPIDAVCVVSATSIGGRHKAPYWLRIPNARQGFNRLCSQCPSCWVPPVPRVWRRGSSRRVSSSYSYSVSKWFAGRFSLAGVKSAARSARTRSPQAFPYLYTRYTNITEPGAREARPNAPTTSAAYFCKNA